MTQLAYQRALCDLVASPRLCLRVRSDAKTALEPYELTDRERRRLEAVVWQKGMSTSCTLYRVNRMTPILTYLPLTCFLLGDQLIAEGERFWTEGAPSDLQFGPETERFARFLRLRLASHLIEDPYLDEVLRFELAVNRLRIASRTEADQPKGAAVDDDGADVQRLHPLAVVVTFDHEPLALLESLAERRRPEVEPQRGAFFVLLDGRGADLRLSQIEPELVRPLLGNA